AEPEITAWMVSPAPWVPKVSSAMPCFWKMPAFTPSVGIWFAQASIWPIATFTTSAARTPDVIAAIAASEHTMRSTIRNDIANSEFQGKARAAARAQILLNYGRDGYRFGHSTPW